jgi:hypothetical protein
MRHRQGDPSARAARVPYRDVEPDACHRGGLSDARAGVIGTAWPVSGRGQPDREPRGRVQDLAELPAIGSGYQVPSRAPSPGGVYPKTNHSP